MIELIDLTARDKWDEIVKSFKQYDVYYLSGYVQSFELNGDGKALLFYYQSGESRAINVTMQRDIADLTTCDKIIEKNKYYDLKTPYGYGGFLLEGFKEKQDYLLLEKEYTAICQKNNFICEVMKFHPILKNYENINEILFKEKIGITVALRLDNEELIWDNMTRESRNRIRKAKKNGIEIFHSKDEDVLNKFIKIYNEVMKYHEANQYYYFKQEFYYSIMKYLKDNYYIFYAQYEGKIIAAVMVLLCNGKMHYHLAASDYTYNHLAPTNLLIYKIACWGSKHSYKLLHLGGGLGAQRDNLYRFKKTFYKGNDYEFWLGEKIFSQNIYDFLCKKTNTNENDYLFPYYCAMKK